MRSLLGAFASLSAIALLAVVHWTILAGLLAGGFVRCKRNRGHRCNQNRKQNFRVILHG